LDQSAQESRLVVPEVASGPAEEAGACEQHEDYRKGKAQINQQTKSNSRTPKSSQMRKKKSPSTENDLVG